MTSRLGPMTRGQCINALVLQHWQEDGGIVDQNAQSFALKFISRLGLQFSVNARTDVLKQLQNVYTTICRRIFVENVTKVYEKVFMCWTDRRLISGYQIMLLIQAQHPNAKPDDEIELQTTDAFLAKEMLSYANFNKCRVWAASECRRQGLGDKIPQLTIQAVSTTPRYIPNVTQ